jgi:hypothetical protein
VSTKGYVVQRKVTFDRGPDGQPRDRQVFEAIEVYEDELRAEPPDLPQ